MIIGIISIRKLQILAEKWFLRAGYSIQTLGGLFPVSEPSSIVANFKLDIWTVTLDISGRQALFFEASTRISSSNRLPTTQGTARTQLQFDYLVDARTSSKNRPTSSSVAQEMEVQPWQ